MDHKAELIGVAAELVSGRIFDQVWDAADSRSINRTALSWAIEAAEDRLKVLALKIKEAVDGGTDSH